MVSIITCIAPVKHLKSCKCGIVNSPLKRALNTRSEVLDRRKLGGPQGRQESSENERERGGVVGKVCKLGLSKLSIYRRFWSVYRTPRRTSFACGSIRELPCVIPTLYHVTRILTDLDIRNGRCACPTRMSFSIFCNSGI